MEVTPLMRHPTVLPLSSFPLSAIWRSRDGKTEEAEVGEDPGDLVEPLPTSFLPALCDLKWEPLGGGGTAAA